MRATRKSKSNIGPRRPRFRLTAETRVGLAPAVMKRLCTTGGGYRWAPTATEATPVTGINSRERVRADRSGRVPLTPNLGAALRTPGPRRLRHLRCPAGRAFSLPYASENEQPSLQAFDGNEPHSRHVAWMWSVENRPFPPARFAGGHPSNLLHLKAHALSAFRSSHPSAFS